MTRRCLLPLLLVAQIIGTSIAVVRHGDFRAESNLRVQSNYSMFTFSHVIGNSTMFNFMRREIGVQQPTEVQQPNPSKVNKAFWVIFTMVFGICGCDRCFMGQICFGVVKGFTLGGFLIWHFLDYVVCLFSALKKEEEIHVVGYDVVFEENSIQTAYYAALIIFIWHMLSNIHPIASAQRQRNLQAEQQAELARNISTDGEDDKGLDVPRRHQSLAYMPTMLTKGLRKAGLVQEKPTIPELLASFDAMDKNGDGQLDHDEIKAALGAMGVSDETVDEMIKDADTDGDGKISKNEFLINLTQKNGNK